MATYGWITAPLNEIRDRHSVIDNTSVARVATVLLEGYAKNNSSSSELIGNGTLFASFTFSAATGPDALTSAAILTEDATGGVYHVTQFNPALNATTGKDYVMAFGAKADTRTKLFVATKATSPNGTETIINLTNGSIFTAGSGRTVTIEALDNGWYWIVVKWSVVGSATADGQAVIGLVNGSNATSYNGDGTSRIYLWRLTCFANRSVGSSPIKSSSAGGWPLTSTDFNGPTEDAYGYGRPPDNPLELDATGIGATPSATTFLLEFYERGSAVQDAAGGTGAYLWAICKYNGTGARLWVKRGTTGYQFGHHNGTAAVTSEAAAFPTYGQKCQLRLLFNSDGSVQLGQSIDQAAEVVASASAANTPAATWATDANAVGRVCMWVNGLGKTNPLGFIALSRIVADSGVKSLAAMLLLA